MYRQIYFLFAGVLLSLNTSCNNEEPATTDHAPEAQPPLDSVRYQQPDYMQVQAPVSLEDISGKVFNFGPDLDTNILESYGECDCCTDDYLFIDDTRFIRLSYCVADYTILKGTYVVSGSEINLTYDSLVINRTYDWDKDAAGETNLAALYMSETSFLDEPVSENLVAWKCKNRFFLSSENDEIYYGTEDLQTTIKTEIELLKMDGSWKLIEW